MRTFWKRFFLLVHREDRCRAREWPCVDDCGVVVVVPDVSLPQAAALRSIAKSIAKKETARSC